MTAPASTKPTGIVRFGIVFGASVAVMVQSLDATIAAVALPHMQGSLSASQDEINWVITSYITAAAIMTAPSGWFADRFGRKRTLVVAIVGFTVASLLTGFAQSLNQVVLCRLLQGAFGAPLVPVTQSLLLETYETKDQPKGLAWWTLGISLGPILGPNLGGWITEHLDWRWVFFVNVPICAVCFTCLAVFVPKDRPQPRGFDWFGFLAAALFIGTFQMMMDRGSEKDWFGSTEIVFYACAAAMGLYFTFVHSFTAAKPLIDFTTLTDRNFASGTIFAIVFSILYMTSTVLTPSFLQTVMGDPVGLSGFLMAPRFVGVCSVMILFGSRGIPVDPRLATLAGVLLISYGMYRMSGWSLNVSTFEIGWNGFFQGIGSGTAIIAMQAWTFGGITSAKRNGASTVYGLARNLGQSVGVSAATAVLIRSVQVNHADIGAHVNAFNRGLQTLPARHFWNLHQTATLAALDGEVNRQSTLIAYLDSFKLLMFVSLVAVPLIFLMRAPRPAAAE